MSVRISESTIDVNDETAALSRGHNDIGAIVTFTGICRGEENGQPIAALTIEHYPGMAETEIKDYVNTAKSRWPLIDATIVHRVGRIKPGEIIVLVITASAHRQAAFSAGEFLMDFLKTRAPFWKKVEIADDSHWVDARATDDAAVEHWEIKRNAAE
jgi:molybdopterin synthase catalytic subunit